MQVLVVGGGIQGLGCAVALAEEGHVVQLLERERPGQRASWVAAGLLTPTSPWKYPPPLLELALASERLYPEFAARLHEHTGIDPEHDACGMLYPSGSATPPGEIEQAMRLRRAMGFDLELLDRDALDALQPGLGPGITGAAWQPRAARIRPPRLLKALVRRAGQLGVELVSECEVVGFARDRDRVTGAITAGGQVLGADVVVLAAGAWSRRLAASAAVDVAVRPVRGQILLLAGEPGVLVPGVIDGDDYLVPRRDGRILVGSTMEDVGFDATNTAEALDALRAAARRLLPAAAGMVEETAWAGLRPGTADRMPYLGPVEQAPGLILACGHFRNGILLAPITAAVVADLVAGREPSVDLVPFAAGRAATPERVSS